MNEFLTTFLDLAFSLPTEPFTWLMIPVVLYWVLSIFGLFHLDLDGLDGALDGAADGVLDGGADSMLDHLDGAGDSLLDHVEGASALDHGAGVHGTLDQSLDHGADGLFGKIGFGDLPRTLTLSLKIFLAWTFSLLASYAIPGFRELAAGALWIGFLLAAAALVLAVAVTAVAIQPLRKVILAGYGPERRDLIGKRCRITTQRVDEHFGQAELEGGTSILQVRNPLGHALTRGTQAVIYDYNQETEVFYVAPLDELGLG